MCACRFVKMLVSYLPHWIALSKQQAGRITKNWSVVPAGVESENSVRVCLCVSARTDPYGRKQNATDIHLFIYFWSTYSLVSDGFCPRYYHIPGTSSHLDIGAAGIASLGKKVAD